MIKVSKGRIPKAKKVVLYGPEGIGKSTFAAQFPDPVFLDTEGSTASMDVARIEPLSWMEMLSDIKEIINGNIDVPCRTIVVDTADWAEKMCADHVCAQNHWDSISSPGYGTGYRVAWEEFGKLLNLLSEAADKGFNIVITAHAMMRKFEQPDEAGSYDRWEMKLQNSPKSNICATVKEWGDMVLFANYKTIVTDKDKQGKGKGKGGRRVMYTEHHPCWDAKNRYGLPSEMDFSYEGIRGIIEEGMLAMNKPTAPEAPAPAPKVEVAKKTHYFVTGDKFWKVEKGEAVPTGDALRDAKEITKREYDAKSVLGDKPKEDASPKQTAFAEKKVAEHKAKQAAAKAEPKEEARELEIDPAIPEKVARLMRQYDTDEWDIQNVVSTKGYFPPDQPVSTYPDDFVDGWLIPYFDKIAAMAKEARNKAEIPFN